MGRGLKIPDRVVVRYTKEQNTENDNSSRNTFNVLAKTILTLASLKQFNLTYVLFKIERSD